MTPFPRCMLNPILSSMLVHNIDLNKNKELDQPGKIVLLQYMAYCKVLKAFGIPELKYFPSDLHSVFNCKQS